MWEKIINPRGLTVAGLPSALRAMMHLRGHCIKWGKRFSLCCWKKCSRSCISAETTGIKSHSLPFLSSPLLSPDHHLPSAAFLIKNHNISDPVRGNTELLGISQAWICARTEQAPRHNRCEGPAQTPRRTTSYGAERSYTRSLFITWGVTLPFDMNLLDISFTVFLATPFRDLSGARWVTTRAEQATGLQGKVNWQIRENACSKMLVEKGSYRYSKR